MGRSFKQRVSYLADTHYLVRLQRAIEADDRRSVEWRREASQHLLALVSMFSQDAQKLVESKGAR